MALLILWLLCPWHTPLQSRSRNVVSIKLVSTQRPISCSTSTIWFSNIITITKLSLKKTQPQQSGNRLRSTSQITIAAQVPLAVGKNVGRDRHLCRTHRQARDTLTITMYSTTHPTCRNSYKSVTQEERPLQQVELKLRSTPILIIGLSQGVRVDSSIAHLRPSNEWMRTCLLSQFSRRMAMRYAMRSQEESSLTQNATSILKWKMN